MMYITMSVTLGVMMSALMMTMCYKISVKSKEDREKSSPFECGFSPTSSPRMPFSIQFFLVAMLFLIFDIEIAIILPLIITMKTSLISSWVMTLSLFVVILILGLYYEWNNGMLEWAT